MKAVLPLKNLQGKGNKKRGSEEPLDCFKLCCVDYAVAATVLKKKSTFVLTPVAASIQSASLPAI